MKPEEKDIRGFLAETFSDFEPTPKREIWEEIAPMIEEKPKRGGWKWGYTLAVACAALLIAIYLFRPVNKPQQEAMVENTGPIQPSIDSTTHYNEKTLVPKEESEVESPKEVSPSTPISPPRQLVNTPQETPQKTLKRDSFEVSPTSNPLYAELETKTDSISTQPMKETGLPEKDREVIAMTSPEKLQEVDLERTSSPLQPEDVPTIEVPALANQAENKNGFSLKELTFEKALMAASEEIDKRFDDAPISAREVEENGETIRTLRLKIGGFSITHKRKVKSSKAKRT
ncbi:MAG: hypothetical protein AAF694_01255 [Bacteroidota bacterium]